MKTKTVSVIPTADSMLAVQAMVEEMMDEAAMPMKIAMKVNIAIDEIYSNIIQYSQAKHAEITCSISESELKLLFTDDGMPYNPLETEDPDVTLGIDEREVGGLGIFIARKIMDELDYTYAEGKNLLTAIKKLQAA